ncbi:MAG: DUF3268 family zinc-finger domain-containing protein [Oscillospiraceae bacterium]|nr:DUF3268 family zinc-finger domain-containing protein [Oscillospiraceae bacterium]
MKQGQEVYCPYCGNKAEYVDSAEIYGKSYGMVYLCRPCDAYVGVHDGTDTPLGRLANRDLRRWRNRAHAAFDPLWQQGRYRRRRNDAYAWLAGKMGLTKEETHIAMFDVEQCKQVIQIMDNERRNPNV